MTCGRTSTVEALQDGRLAGVETEAMRAHVAECAECAAEGRRLAELRSALLALSEREADGTRVLAGRRRLLAAAEGELERRPSIRPAGFALVAAALVLAVGTGVGAWRARTHAVSGGVAAAGPGFELSVTPLAGARWSRASTPGADKVTLDDGGLRVAVKRHEASHRLVVALPDGELEDVGTVFSVSVASGKTREVSVSEGVVALRLRGRPEQRLAAGESYRASEEPALASASTPPASAGAATPDAAVVPPSEPARAPAEVQRTPPHERVEVDACPDSALFPDGVEAFRRGDYANAASTLQRFSVACARSGHAEDAAYLRMVALARGGRGDEARLQAQAYLKRFPNGFRRKEAERLAGAE